MTKAKTGITALVISLCLAGCGQAGIHATQAASETTAGDIQVVVEYGDGSSLVLIETRGDQAMTEAESSLEESKTTEPTETDAASEEATSETGVSGGQGETTEDGMDAENSTENMLEEAATAEGFNQAVTCISDGARVRETPNGTILGNLQYGDTVMSDGEIENGWIHIYSETYGTGYVFQRFMSFEQ